VHHRLEEAGSEVFLCKDEQADHVVIFFQLSAERERQG
jgi:hypothetical protein